MARIAIAWLERRQFRLSPPDEEGLHLSLDKIAALYRDAYGWTPPKMEIGERLAGKLMRQYVKSWITTWDIQRLYGEITVIRTDTIPIDYTESSDIEQSPEGGEEDDAAA